VAGGVESGAADRPTCRAGSHRRVGPWDAGVTVALDNKLRGGRDQQRRELLRRARSIERPATSEILNDGVKC
jgi:hypothetical protein